MIDLTALVGSRICHDLISPLGAIGNGMELLQMSAGRVAGEELALISDSVERANARIRLFRLAFGAATAEAEVPGREISEVLQGYYDGGRLSARADTPAALPRLSAKIALLAALCAETALPRGGQIMLGFPGTGIELVAEGARLTLAPDLWTPLVQGRAPQAELRAAEVQFALLPIAAVEAGRTIALDHDETRLVLKL